MDENIRDNIMDIWLKIAGSYCCRYPCNTCHQILNTECCPNDIDVNRDDVDKFIREVTTSLKIKTDDSLPFYSLITEDEIMDVIKHSLDA